MEPSNVNISVDENIYQCLQEDSGKRNRIVYFGDGEVEEDAGLGVRHQHHSASSLDLDEIDESNLSWIPYLKIKACKTGNSMLNGIDYAGETLTSFFGITTPKYASEIREFERMEKEASERQRLEDEEYGNWLQGNNSGKEPITKQVLPLEGVGDNENRF